MRKNLKQLAALAAFFSLSSSAIAQGGGQVHGSFRSDFQVYQEDTIIGAKLPDEKVGANSYLNMIYTNNDFEAGLRFEAYAPTLQGFDARYSGYGIANKYIKYTKDQFEFTAGNFYEQFGSGMIFRAYQEWELGFDNSMNGIRVKATFPGLTIKGVLGTQRYFWGQSAGTIRGVDAELQLNDAFKKLANLKTRYVLGGNFVSRFQEDKDPIYILPENVGAGSGRLAIYRGAINFNAEYGYKINDPNTSNGMIYKPGNAVILGAGYSKKGLGFTIQAKRTDNMDFRADRTATGFNLPTGYIPAMTLQHAYTLPAYYPYATQANGEMGLQTSINYKIKKSTAEKKSLLGGKYGTSIDINFSISKAIDKDSLNDTTAIGESGTLGYKSNPFKVGKELYYQDFNIKITKKLSPKLTASLTYVNIFYNMMIIEGHNEPNVRAQSFVADVWWKFKPNHSLHFDAEAMFTKEDWGNWAFGMVEYNYKSFFAAVIDNYNYGNPDDLLKVHYFSLSSGYTWKTTRIAMTYGKQSSGILCVGGVCREVPATNGFSVSISSSF